MIRLFLLFFFQKLFLFLVAIRMNKALGGYDLSLKGSWKFGRN